MSFGFHCQLQATLLSTVRQHEAAGVKCVQTYIGGNQTYTRRAFAEPDLAATKQYLDATGFRLYTHSCLCMNLASGYQTNVDCLLKELVPVLATGASTVVHIGSRNVNKQPVGTLDNVVQTVKKLGVKGRTGSNEQRWPVLLENAAGEGAKFGSSLNDLEYLFRELKNDGVGLCLDTAHAFGAGVFDFQSEESILEMFELVYETVGRERFQLLHLNDSKIVFGGCNDRHESLGKGYIWEESLEPCKFLLKECRKRGIDVVLETPDVLENYAVGCGLLG